MKYKKLKVTIDNKTYLIIIASIIGEGKTENQDSVDLLYDDKQIIVALADGLGSAIFSKEGSSKIVNITLDLLAQEKIKNLPNNILQEWSNSINDNLELYDTTIKFIKIMTDKIIYGGIGDGWIAIKDINDFISVTSNNVFSNQTDSILSFNLTDKFLIKEINNTNITSIIIASDGFSEDIDKQNGYKFLEEIDKSINVDEEKFCKDIQNTLENWPVKTNRDDKTVVFINLLKGDNK